MSDMCFEALRESFVEVPALGIWVDGSRMDMDLTWRRSMQEPMSRAFRAMEDLEAGGTANPDEGRRVGHYWLRTPALAPDAATRSAIERTLADIRRFAAAVRSGGIRPAAAPAFRRLLVIGIGGSALGPQFVADALGDGDDLLAPRFIDNTDPDGIDRVLRGLRGGLPETLCVVISKSGGTPETRNGMIEVASAFARAGLEFPRHAVAVTGEGSALDREAAAREFLARFPMWDWVGGRTSEFSAVGLLPAALQGLDIDGLLEGAALMDAATRIPDPAANPAALLALAWHFAGGGRGARDMVVLPYRDRLALFSRYLQQLVMESLGKERDLDGRIVRQGLAVYGNKGSTDQHAYVQQLRDGLDNFFVTFVEALEDRAGPSVAVEPGVVASDYLHGFLLGTRQALHENGRLSLLITLPRVDARSVGGLIALFERAVGLYAALIRVNAYHQPGVEAGKKAAQAVIDLSRRVLAAIRAAGGRRVTAAELAEDLREADIGTVWRILQHVSRVPDHGVRRAAAVHPLDDAFSADS